jgi:hypothetical protein
LAVVLDIHRGREVRHDLAIAVGPREAAEDEARDITVDIGLRDQWVEMGDAADDTLDVAAAEGGKRRRTITLGNDSCRARESEKADEDDDEELVASGQGVTLVARATSRGEHPAAR